MGHGHGSLPAGALEEIEKQEEEAEEDLRLLERESSARKAEKLQEEKGQQEAPKRQVVPSGQRNNTDALVFRF